MATTKTGVVKLSGLTITEKAAGTSVEIKGSNATKLSITTVDDEATTKIVGKKTATYILEDYKQIFTGNRTSVSLFGSEVDGFDATAYDKYAAVKVINATATAAEDISLVGNDIANQIIANNGGASMNGGAGNDTLTGGKGADTFIYTAGKDVIKSFSASSDAIVIENEDISVTDASISGNHITLKFDKNNSLQIQGMAKKTLTFTENGNARTISGGILYGDDTAVVTSAFTATKKTTVNNATTIDASALTKKAVNLAAGSENVTMIGGSKNDTLTGNSGDDSIDGGKGNDKLYGGAGNDSILCGLGNDTLWGGDGENVFTYAKGDGKDVIVGFTSDDTLTLDDITFSSATVNSKGTQVTLKLGTGSVIFKDVDSSIDFHIGESTYNIEQSGKNKYSFVEKTT